MKKLRRVIWFVEEGWTRQHVAIGVDPEHTICGITRSTRRIQRSEMISHIGFDANPYPHCMKCLAALRRHFGSVDAAKVYVQE